MVKNGLLYEIDEFESGNEFINLGINMTKYDIVFLDINMDEMDGIETAQEIRKVSNDIFIVFVTAFINYAVEGYSVNAIRYILKNNENFSELIFECIDAISKKMNDSVKKKEFKFSEGVKNISLELLLYIESKLHKLNLHSMEDKINKYSLYGKLDEVEKELEDKAFLQYSNETIQIEWDSFEYLQKKLSGSNNSRSKITRQILLHDSRKEVRMQKNTKNEPVSGGISIHRG